MNLGDCKQHACKIWGVYGHQPHVSVLEKAVYPDARGRIESHECYRGRRRGVAPRLVDHTLSFVNQRYWVVDLNKPFSLLIKRVNKGHVWDCGAPDDQSPTYRCADRALTARHDLVAMGLAIRAMIYAKCDHYPAEKQ